MRISFCFQGWVSGADIDKVTEVATGNEVSVSGKSVKELVDGLTNGKYALSLSESMDCCKQSECEIFDYEEY